MTAPPTALAPIPIVDVREDGPVRHAIDGRVRALALRNACVGWLPRLAAGLLPAINSVTRQWLLRSRSPYTPEVQAVPSDLGFPASGFSMGVISGAAQRSPANKAARHGSHARLIGRFPGSVATWRWRGCVAPPAISIV